MTSQPTQLQCDQAVAAQSDFEELIDRLIVAGYDYRSILVGAAVALTNSIAASAGMDKPSIWFAQQSALTMHLADKR